MNFFKIIDQLSEVDPDVLDRFDSRRAVFSSLGTFAKRSALAATPLLLGSLFQKAYAGTTSVPVDILNYTLTLELLEADFYRQFLASNLIPAGAPAAAIAKIKQHEDAHVLLLATTIRSLGGTPVAGTATTGVRFRALPTGTTYDTYLKVAQVLEDTGVRAYKGRARELVGDPNGLLTVALQIHSVEARHAAHIRTMRSQLPWVSNTDDLKADPAYSAAYLNGITGTATPSTSVTFGGVMFGIPPYDIYKPSRVESNVLQGAVGNAVAVSTATALLNTYNADAAAAAFDESLQAAEVFDASRAGGLLA